MSAKADVQAAFGTVAEIGNAWVTVGSRSRVRCLVPDGLEIDGERLPGYSRSITRATVTVSAADFGRRPDPEERAKLEMGTEIIDMTVSANEASTVTAAGALLQFPLTTE